MAYIKPPVKPAPVAAAPVSTTAPSAEPQSTPYSDLVNQTQAEITAGQSATDNYHKKREAELAAGKAAVAAAELRDKARKAALAEAEAAKAAK
jgi:hypothetical protein